MSGQEMALAQGLQAGGAEGLAAMGGAQGLQAGLASGGFGFQAPQTLGLQGPISNVAEQSMANLALGGSQIPSSLASNSPIDPSMMERLAGNPSGLLALSGAMKKDSPPPMLPPQVVQRGGMQAIQMPQMGTFNPFMVRGMRGRI